MNNSEKILKYIAENMSDDEKRNFEIELQNSQSLQSEFAKIKSSLKLLKENSKIEISETYFQNLIPRMREKQQSKKQPFGIIPKIGFAVPVLIIFFVIGRNIIVNDKDTSGKINEIQMLTDSFDDSVKRDLFENLFEKEYFASVDVKEIAAEKEQEYFDILEYEYKNEISGNEKIEDLASLNLSELVEVLDSKAADEVYNKMLEKDFLGEP